MLIALVFSIVLFAGLAAYASIIFGTVARGVAIPQEILVSKESGDE